MYRCVYVMYNMYNTVLIISQAFFDLCTTEKSIDRRMRKGSICFFIQ